MTISVEELKRRLDAGESIQLVDVRQLKEWEICRLPQATLIPLGEFAARAPVELDPDNVIALYCHHGVRSAQAQTFLTARGFQQVLNIVGGIDAWAVKIDSSMPRY